MRSALVQLQRVDILIATIVETSGGRDAGRLGEKPCNQRDILPDCDEPLPLDPPHIVLVSTKLTRDRVH